MTGNDKNCYDKEGIQYQLNIEKSHYIRTYFLSDLLTVPTISD